MTSQVYRQAASALVLRPRAAGGHDFLLLHKPRRSDAWQLPQGGMEAGESLEQAALRELQEEASIGGCRVLGESKRVYQYDFPASYRRFRPDNVCGQRIGFILVLAPKDADVTVDRSEIDDYRWLSLEEFEKYVRRPEYAEVIRELYGEALGFLG